MFQQKQINYLTCKRICEVMNNNDVIGLILTFFGICYASADSILTSCPYPGAVELSKMYILLTFKPE